ncbi:MAG: cell division protein CrgA [Jatrophihabitans sp.]|nr:MAG: cell division protein CrgA [Jatrophihabitans sp.]
MPKSKVRKKPEAPVRSEALRASTASHGLRPSPTWYPIVMASLMVLGLAYMVVYYLTSSGTSPHVPVMADLGSWNFAVGFGVMLLGLVMAVRWR